MTAPKPKRRIRVSDLLARCDEVGDCRLWKQALTTNGYARIGIEGLPQYAHVAAWVLRNGPVPVGKRLGNCCGNRNCIQPRHWKAMTASELNLLAASNGAWSSPLRAMKIAKARRGRGKLDDQKVAAINGRAKSADEYAAEFGVDRSLIFRIWRGEAWVPFATNSSVFNRRA